MSAVPPPSLARPPNPHVARLRAALRAAIHGKDDVIELALVAALAGGHLLLEDVPGVGKTTLAATLARALGGTFSRIQCTSDLLPSDLTGALVLDRSSGELVFRPGPLFANVVLADELNRTSPKTQSALFEAMTEGRVTVDGETHRLPEPFLVIATQNPYDSAGTYPLPDSQRDRFLMRLHMGYPDREAERAVLRAQTQRHGAAPSPSALTPAEATALQAEASAVRVPQAVEDYLLDVVAATRVDERLLRGASTRGAVLLQQAVRARALLAGRHTAVYEDVLDLAIPVLGHRVRARTGTGAHAISATLETLRAPP